MLVREPTGRLTAWIEVGAPDAGRLHYASKLVDRTTVYTHRDPEKVIAAWAGKRIHRGSRFRGRSGGAIGVEQLLMSPDSTAGIAFMRI